METVTSAIVLRKTPYTASSAVVAMYSEKFGQTTFMVRGLGKKGGMQAALQPLTRVEVTCRFHENKSLQTARSVRLLNPGGGTAFYDPVKVSMALFLAEVLYKALREESPDSELFAYLNHALTYFEDSPPDAVFHLQLMAKLTKFLGFFPAGRPGEGTPYFDLENGTYTADREASLYVLPAEESRMMYRLAHSEFHGVSSPSNSVKRRLLSALADYYRIHLEGFGELKSLPVLKELFA